MNDKELLELAARAAGYRIEEYQRTGGFITRQGFLEWRPWDPLNDDGDALRLACEVRATCRPDKDECHAFGKIGMADWCESVEVSFDGDIAANRESAMRRAIVLFAAEVGSREA
ncbi:hypothetical protein NJF44_01245 [Pseudomonas guariconensis]|uniref:hypothetical protein n=1 Tax=Pseudomonas TaxID=286 RepID=UPI0020972817|nr:MULTISPECIES: hypothetical protein [Pseudomonas]MCO7513731.1 hypothetical protein [Pseudomonas putida]MCO7603868.1 hypothetical protein [Pseudomonas guariconensis]